MRNYRGLHYKKAAEIIEKGGIEDFSMRLLADKLNIKTASLYNHIKIMEELMIRCDVMRCSEVHHEYIGFFFLDSSGLSLPIPILASFI